MKSNILYLSIAIFFTIQVNAQNNFVAGNYVDTNGKTVYGLISKQKWIKNPSEIYFKLSKEVDSKTIRIVNISSFSLDGGEYFKKESIFVDAEIAGNKKNEFKKEVLLKVLSIGKASLYYYADNNNKTFYYSKDGGQIIALSQKRMITSGKYLSDINKVKQDVFNLFSDCESLDQEDVYKLTYTESSLRSIFSDYNECSGSSQQVFKKENNLDFRLGVIAGYNSSEYNGIDLRSFVQIGLLTTADEIDLGSFSGIVYGLEGELIFINVGVSAFFNIIIQPEYSTAASVNFSGGGGGTTEGELSSRYNSFTFGGRKYINLTDDLKIFGSLGISFHTTKENFIFFEDINAIIVDRASYTNAIFGIGVEFKNFFIEPRFDLGREIFRNDAKSFNLLAGYKFL